MRDSDDPRIDAMYRRDRLFAWSFIVALWVVLTIVLVSVWNTTSDGAIRLVLAVAAGLVVLFNTAAITVMVRHFSEDRLHIYGLDLKHIDARRARRANGKAAREPAA